MIERLKTTGLGLTPEEHEDLNQGEETYPGGPKAKEKRIAELRKKYSDNAEALKQIDVYESSSGYIKKMRELIDRLTVG